MKKVVEVIVLGVKSYSETSIWVCFFSREYGIQNGIIKGGKKKRTKTSVLGLFDFTLYKPSGNNLQTIVELERSVSLDLIYSSPVKVLIAFFMAESYRSTLVNCGVDASFFEFSSRQIHSLSKEESTGSFPVYFLARLISFLGYAPLSPSEKVKSFDPINGFNSAVPSIKTLDDPLIVIELYYVFNNREGKLLHQKKVFEALINYACHHVPGYKLNKSIEVIRDVLYS